MQAKSLLLGFALALPVMAPVSAGPLPLAAALSRKTPPAPYVGQRELKVYRQNSQPYATTLDIHYRDAENYDLTLTGPAEMSGLRINTVAGVTSALFPGEKQLFDSFAFQPAARTLVNQLSARQELIGENYELKLQNKDAVVNGTHTYVIDFVPKHTVADASGRAQLPIAPRRRYWLEQNSLQVMREERYWDWKGLDGSWNYNASPYFTSAFLSYSTAPGTAVTPLAAAGDIKAFHLSGQTGKWLSYPNAPEAQKHEGLNIAQPGYLPPGFKLVDIQILNMSGTRIQLQNYTDGVNDLMIASLPANQLMNVLSTGLSFAMVQKLSALTVQLPYNFVDASAGDHLVEVFGDVLPEELQRVGAHLRF